MASEGNTKCGYSSFGMTGMSFILIVLLGAYTYLWENSCILWEWYWVAGALLIVIAMAVVCLAVKNEKTSAMINLGLSIVFVVFLFLAYYRRTVAIFVQGTVDDVGANASSPVAHGYVLVFMGPTGGLPTEEGEEKSYEIKEEMQENLKKLNNPNLTKLIVPFPNAGKDITTLKILDSVFRQIRKIRYSAFIKKGRIIIEDLQGLSDYAEKMKFGMKAKDVGDKFFEKSGEKKKEAR